MTEQDRENLRVLLKDMVEKEDRFNALGSRNIAFMTIDEKIDNDMEYNIASIECEEARKRYKTEIFRLSKTR